MNFNKFQCHFLCRMDFTTFNTRKNNNATKNTNPTIINNIFRLLKLEFGLSKVIEPIFSYFGPKGSFEPSYLVLLKHCSLLYLPLLMIRHHLKGKYQLYFQFH